MAVKPDAERAQAAQAEIDVVRPFAQAGQAHGVFQFRNRRRIGRDGAEHDVGVAADIFGAGLDDEIDTMIERPEIERRRPGIVHQHQRTIGMRGFGDRRHVLHFEGERARRFQIDGTRVRLQQLGNAGPDAGIVIRGGDAEPRQDLSAKIPCRPIGAVGDQHMIAGTHDRQQGGRNRRKPGRQQRHAGALRPFELLQRELERLGGRRTAAAVLIARAMGEEILGIGIEHGRGVIDRRIDEAVVGAGIATRRHQFRRRAPRPGLPVVSFIVHGSISARFHFTGMFRALPRD